MKIDGLMLGWSSGVRLHVESGALVLDSDLGRVTITRDAVERVERVRGLRTHGVRIVVRGSEHFIWSFHPGELETTFDAGGWPIRDVRTHVVGPRRAIRGGASFTTDRAVAA